MGNTLSRGLPPNDRERILPTAPLSSLSSTGNTFSRGLTPHDRERIGPTAPFLSLSSVENTLPRGLDPHDRERIGPTAPFPSLSSVENTFSRGLPPYDRERILPTAPLSSLSCMGNSHSEHGVGRCEGGTKRNRSRICQLLLFGRNEATRTPDPYVPNVVRYQLRYIPISFDGAKVRVFFELQNFFIPKTCGE